MATISPSGSWHAKGVYISTWSSVTTSGDTINYESAARLPDKTVQVDGEFGSGPAVVTMLGRTSTTASGIVLTDPQGNNLTFSAAGHSIIAENPEFVGFTVSGSSASTSVNVRIISSA
jgi:hypothetical protein